MINTSLPTVHSATLADALNKWDVARSNDPAVHEFYRAAPGGVPTQTAFSQSSRYNELDLDRESGVIRNRETRFRRMAVLPFCLATSPKMAAW